MSEDSSISLLLTRVRSIFACDNDLGDPQQGELDAVATSGERLGAVKCSVMGGTVKMRESASLSETCISLQLSPLRPEGTGRTTTAMGRPRDCPAFNKWECSRTSRGKAVGLERAPAQVMTSEETLVLGGSGFVGRELVDQLACRGTSSHPQEGFLTVDATRISDLRAQLLHLAPKVLINCVGLADVDRAEREPSLATALNETVVVNLVELQQEIPFRLVHISTDYVFDGQRGMYREDDSVNPVNEYGRSKLAGERAAQRSDSALVVRISSPFGKGFGARKPQFFRYVTDTLRSGKTVKALTDQRVTATFLPDLARAIETLLQQEARGIVHVASENPLSRFEFARQIAGIVGADLHLVVGARVTDMTQWTAQRPADTTLDVGLSRRSGVQYTPVSEALRILLTS